MADAASLFDLAASIRVDASQSDRALTETQKKVLALAKQFQDTEKKATDSNKKIGQSELTLAQQMKAVESLQRQRSAAFLKQLKDQENAAKKAAAETAKAARQAGDDAQSALSAISPKLAGIIGASGPLTAVALGIAAIGAAAGGAYAAIYSLTTAVAESTGHFKDLSQQTGFSVETLSALANAAETSGGGIDTVTSALFLFETKMGEAKDKTSEMSKLFKELNIDTSNNEKALRQALTAVAGLSSAEERATIGKKLFGRSVKDLLGALAEAGNLDAYMNEQIKRGTLITTDAAERGDKLSDSVVEMGRAYESARRIIADQFGPDVLAAVRALTKLIEDNRGVIKEWAEEFSNVAHALDPLIASIRVLDSALRNLAGINLTDTLGAILRYGSGAGLLFTAAEKLGAAARPSTSTSVPDLITPLLSRRPASLRNVDPFAPRTSVSKFLSGRGGGGGGGGAGRDPAADQKRLVDIQMRIALEGLKREEDDIERSYDRRRTLVEVYERALGRIEEEHHKVVLDGLKSEEDAIKKSKKLTGLQLSVALQELELKKMQEANRHRQAEIKLEDSILRITRERYVTAERLAGLTTRPRRAGEDIGGVTRPRRAGEDITGLTRPRIATDLEAAMREQYRDFLDRAHQAASNIANMLDRALYDGFTGGGVKAGLASLGQGLLDIVEHYFLNRLEKGLFDLFSQLGQKGGIWGTIFGIASGAAGGFVGGTGAGGIGGIGTVLAGGGALGSAFAGGFASGGTIPMGQWGIVHEGEKVVAGPRGAKVIPSGGGSGAIHNHYHTWNVVTRDASSFMSRDTQTQIARRMNHIQQKVALTG